MKACCQKSSRCLFAFSALVCLQLLCHASLLSCRKWAKTCPTSSYISTLPFVDVIASVPKQAELQSPLNLVDATLHAVIGPAVYSNMAVIGYFLVVFELLFGVLLVVRTLISVASVLILAVVIFAVRWEYFIPNVTLFGWEVNTAEYASMLSWAALLLAFGFSLIWRRAQALLFIVALGVPVAVYAYRQQLHLQVDLSENEYAVAVWRWMATATNPLFGEGAAVQAFNATLSTIAERLSHFGYRAPW